MPKKVNKESTPVVKKKRGRKPKAKKIEEQNGKPTIVVKKKRGRKPKGGKIITKDKLNLKKETIQNHNVILHLKCKKDSVDLNDNMELNVNNITNYDPNINNPLAFTLNSNSKYPSLGSYEFQNVKVTSNKKIKKINTNEAFYSKEEKKENNNDINIKDIWLKLELLKNKLRHNNVSDKKSSCFWCTYPFDNPAVYIPMSYDNNYYNVYGCFCSPECAVAYLKKENIDNSTLWERYALLNNIYSKIFNYNKNIKPAPNPYYTLDKFYGNLNIQEYRKLLKNDRLLMIVDKPMTKILPELYEENNEIPNVFFNLLENNHEKKGSSDYRLKRKKTSHSKNEILSSTFNF